MPVYHFFESPIVDPAYAGRTRGSDWKAPHRSPTFTVFHFGDPTGKSLVMPQEWAEVSSVEATLYPPWGPPDMRTVYDFTWSNNVRLNVNITNNPATDRNAWIQAQGSYDGGKYWHALTLQLQLWGGGLKTSAWYPLPANMKRELWVRFVVGGGSNVSALADAYRFDMINLVTD